MMGHHIEVIAYKNVVLKGCSRPFHYAVIKLEQES
jgi:hypothetical protein